MKRHKLTPTEQRLRKRYTKEVRMGKTYGADLIVWDRIHQGFRIAEDVTRSEAAWYRDMLAVALARMLTTEGVVDYPENDHTDYAHPAWWRGNDAATDCIAQRIHEWLDGKDNGSGVINHHELERARRRVLKLVKETESVDVYGRGLDIGLANITPSAADMQNEDFRRGYESGVKAQKIMSD